MYVFGDSFDLYATIADVAPSYWDSASNGSLQAPGRFGGQGYRSGWTGTIVKASNVNDPVHHINVALMSSTFTADTFPGFVFTFFDGATAQCSVYAGWNGTLYLCSGAYGGTVLDSFAGAFTARNQWVPFEIEVVINNTTGSWTIRKGGNTGTPDRTLGGLNTRGGTANNYANKLQIGPQNPTGNDTGQVLDDLLWRSGDASGTLPNGVPWLGDIRCYTRMPASDQSVQFAKNAATITQSTGGVYSTYGGGSPGYTFISPPVDGTIGSITFNMNAAFTGNIKFAIFANAGGVPGAIISSTAIATNPPVGNTTLTLTTPAPVKRGTSYFIGFISDTGAATFMTSNTAGSLYNNSVIPTYTDFPQASPPIYGPNNSSAQFSYVVTATNTYSFVSDPQQDGLATYVFDSVVGHADLYGVASIGVTPASTVCVTTRAFAQKSDSGAKSGAVQLKSGGTTVQSTPGPLSTTFAWNYRTDLIDPATGVAWTASGVNNVQIGPIVTA